MIERNPAVYPFFQVIDADGNPVAGGQVYTYEPGTSTPKEVYENPELTTPTTQPVVLNSKGEAKFYYKGRYKINVLTAAGVQVDGFPLDNVTGDNEGVAQDNYYPDYALDDQGEISANGSIAYYADEICTKQATIVLRHNSGNATTEYTLNTSLELPDNILLKVENGVRIVIASGVTFTINKFEAGLYQVFAGDGDVSFGIGSVKEIYPEWWGAIGDGITDDTEAIDKANITLCLSSTLLAKKTLVLLGTYLYKGQSKLGAITLTDISGFTIDFRNNGKLLMDNLNNSGLGVNSGLFISGTAEDITLINPFIEWKVVPSTRSQGDGITLKGNPNDDLCLNKINILGKAKIKNSPQVGMLVMGCKNVFINSFEANNSLGDGLHFNACQNITVLCIKGIQTGDDSLAFVTYNDVQDGGGTSWKTSRDPYSQPSLGVWSNYNCSIGEVLSLGGIANACRIAGSNNITISSITVIDKVFGVQIDGGIKDATHSWTYQVSKKINIGSISCFGCFVGLLVQTFNVTESDIDYWNFDVSIGKVSCENPGQYSVALENGKGISINSIRSRGNDGAISSILIQYFSNVNIGTIDVSDTRIDINNCNDMAITSINMLYTYLYMLTNNNLSIKNIYSKDSPAYGIFISALQDSYLGNIEVINNNTGNNTDINYMRGLLLNQAKNVYINYYHYYTIYSNYRSLDLGGGSDPNYATDNLTIGKIMIDVPTTVNINKQTGTFGCINLKYTGKSLDRSTSIWSSIDFDSY